MDSSTKTKDITYKGAEIKVGIQKSWINKTRGEYQGTYIVPISDMSDNIGSYNQKRLKKNLAKHSARKKRLEKGDEDIEDDILDISVEVTKTVISEGPFICSECLGLRQEWKDMQSGLYTNLKCKGGC